MPSKKKKPKGNWGGKRKGAGSPHKIVGATTKSVVLDEECLRIIAEYIKQNNCNFSEAVRGIVRGASHLRPHRL